MKKKWIMMVICVTLAVSMAACGAKDAADEDAGSKPGIEQDVTDGAIDQVTSGAVDDSTGGAIDQVTSGALGDNTSGTPGAKPVPKPETPAEKPTEKPVKPVVKPVKPVVKPDKPVVSVSLEDKMTAIYDGLDAPKTAITEVNRDNMEYYLGTKDLTFKRAIASEAMISSVAHSLVLLEVEDGADIKGIKTKIKDNVNGRKWVCVGVEPEDILVENVGNYILLVMDEEAQTFMDRFLSLK